MRLIDADKLLRFFTVDTANQTYRFGTIKKQIENAETVQAIIIPENATDGDEYVEALYIAKDSLEKLDKIEQIVDSRHSWFTIPELEQIREVLNG